MAEFWEKLAGGNIYLGIVFIGFFLGLGCFVISLGLMVFVQTKFEIYIRRHDQVLWKEYKIFKPGEWWRTYHFMKLLKQTNDANISQMRVQLLRYEKFAIITLLVAMGFVVSIIIVGTITQKMEGQL